MLRIKDMREDKDLLQKDVADFLNISQTNYSKYELGKINIPISTLKKMAIFFDTSIDYLLGLTDEIKPYPRKKWKIIKFLRKLCKLLLTKPIFRGIL